MAEKTLIQVRVDQNLKNDAESIFSDLGLDLSTAVRIFLKQSVVYNGLPFDMVLKRPNKTTIEALEEAERISKEPQQTKGHKDAKSMVQEILG